MKYPGAGDPACPEIKSPGTADFAGNDLETCKIDGETPGAVHLHILSLDWL